MFDADTAGAHDIQTLDIDALIVRFRPLGFTQPGLGTHHQRRIALGRGLPFRIQIQWQQRLLTAQQMLDALCHRSPLLPGHIEMSSEIHQRALTDPLVGTNRLD